MSSGSSEHVTSSSPLHFSAPPFSLASSSLDTTLHFHFFIHWVEIVWLAHGLQDLDYVSRLLPLLNQGGELRVIQKGQFRLLLSEESAMCA